MSASGHYTRGRSLRINNKAVSVSSPCFRRSSSPTLFIGPRRARLLTSSTARLSPQTCFRLPHCLGCFAACGFPRPPALRRAGIDEPVTVYEGGKTRKGPKYLFVTSHTFRISFVTNLHKAGLDLLTISRMAGHTNVAMTERYCAYIEPKIQTAEAAGYLGL